MNLRRLKRIINRSIVSVLFHLKYSHFFFFVNFGRVFILISIISSGPAQGVGDI